MSSIFTIRWKNDKPPSLEEFMDKQFPSDKACAEYLAKIRWPEGFECPRCGGKRGWALKSRTGVYKGAGDGELQNGKRCCHQTSVTAGTIMHGTRIPMRKWFQAAYLVATHSNGISALQLQSKLGLGSYKSAWSLLNKLRSSSGLSLSTTMFTKMSENWEIHSYPFTSILIITLPPKFSTYSTPELVFGCAKGISRDSNALQLRKSSKG